MYSLAWKMCRCGESYQCAGTYYDYDRQEFWSDEDCDRMEEYFEYWLTSLAPYQLAARSETGLKLFFGLLEEVPQHIRDNQLTKEKIKESLILSTVISQSVELKKVGRDKYQGKCPWHVDNKASLSVDDKKGLYNCFAGCGGGDVFNWLMKKYELTFMQAMEVGRKLL